MVRQIPLDLETRDAFARSRLVVTPALAPVVDELLRPDLWPGLHVGLIGREGTGKTHLAHAFAEVTGGVCVDGDKADALRLDGLPAGALAVDDADLVTDERLFHLFNRAVSLDAPLLLTSRHHPLAWPASLPDLTSRLRSLRLLTLPEPDDVLLAGIMRKLFAQRAISPADEVISYALSRMERSATAAKSMVSDLEQAANGRPFNRALVKHVLLRREPSLFPSDEGDDFNTV